MSVFEFMYGHGFSCRISSSKLCSSGSQQGLGCEGVPRTMTHRGTQDEIDHATQMGDVMMGNLDAI